MWEHVLPAMAMSATWPILITIIVGTIAGITIGALPGLGTVLGLVMAIPFTIAMDGPMAIALLLSIYVSSIYGGSISAIMINVPGTPQSAASVFDGYPMAQRGDGALALGFATIASFVGGIFSLVVLVFTAPTLAKISLEFGPIETFSLLLFALMTVAWVSGEEMLKGILAALIGLFLALVGTDSMSGYSRFDFGNLFLSAGFTIIPLLIGVFAISEVLFQAGTLTDSSMPSVKNGGFRVPPWAMWRPRIVTLFRSCGIGSLIGILPGTGATAAVFVSYADARRRADNPEDFGKGEPSGLIAAESANNAVSGGAMVPLLSLGIPGDGGTAVMLGALTIHSVIPGVTLFTDQPDLVTMIFVLLGIANVFMLIIGALGANLFSRMLSLPITLLMPLVVLMSLVGTYAIRSNPVDLIVVIVFGVAGFLLRLNKFPPAPIIIGFVLGEQLEFSLRQGLQIKNGNFTEFFHEPIAAFFLVLTGLILLKLLGVYALMSRLVRPRAV